MSSHETDLHLLHSNNLLKIFHHEICHSINFLLDSPLDISADDLQANDFQIQLPSSYSFKLKTIDLVKLNAIRVSKNEKKHEKFFEEIGLPTRRDKPYKIFLSKQHQTKTNKEHESGDKSGKRNRLGS